MLTDLSSTDWQSLTLTGERHQLALRVSPPDSATIVERMCGGIGDAEFSLPGLIVADIVVFGEPQLETDGSTRITIEALTIEE